MPTMTHANGTVVRTTSCKIAKKGSIRIAHAAAVESQEPAVAADPEPEPQSEPALQQSEQALEQALRGQALAPQASCEAGQPLLPLPSATVFATVSAVSPSLRELSPSSHTRLVGNVAPPFPQGVTWGSYHFTANHTVTQMMPPVWSPSEPAPGSQGYSRR